MENLNGLKVAILVENGFEWVELVEPRKALDQAGAETRIVSPRDQRVKGWKFTEWGDELPVDVALDQALARNFDALLLPGGVMNPDALRMQPKAVAFVKEFFDAGKPVAVICHGPWTVIEAEAARGRRIASWPSLKTDLRNAGAEWMDREVVVDNNLVSSRKPDDIQHSIGRCSNCSANGQPAKRVNHGRRAIVSTIAAEAPNISSKNVHASTVPNMLFQGVILLNQQSSVGVMRYLSSN